MPQPNELSAARLAASSLLRAAALALCVPALWGGIESCREAVELVNQDWLHWFPVGIHRSSPHGPLWLLTESALVGTVACLLGSFLLLFAMSGADGEAA